MRTDLPASTCFEPDKDGLPVKVYRFSREEEDEVPNKKLLAIIDIVDERPRISYHIPVSPEEQKSVVDYADGLLWNRGSKAFDTALSFSHRSEFKKRLSENGSASINSSAPQKKLVLCEGETEVTYFSALVKHYGVEKKFEIRKGTNNLPLGLVEEAVKTLSWDEQLGNKYKEAWVVFDRDSHYKYLETCAIAERHPRIKTGWSHPCFEIWLLLHHRELFDKKSLVKTEQEGEETEERRILPDGQMEIVTTKTYRQSLDSKQMEHKLKELLPNFKKNGNNYETLFVPFVEKALERSEKINQSDPQQYGTSVGLLVKEILKCRDMRAQSKTNTDFKGCIPCTRPANPMQECADSSSGGTRKDSPAPSLRIERSPAGRSIKIFRYLPPLIGKTQAQMNKHVATINLAGSKIRTSYYAPLEEMEDEFIHQVALQSTAEKICMLFREGTGLSAIPGVKELLASSYSLESTVLETLARRTEETKIQEEFASRVPKKTLILCQNEKQFGYFHGVLNHLKLERFFDLKRSDSSETRKIVKEACSKVFADELRTQETLDEAWIIFDKVPEDEYQRLHRISIRYPKIRLGWSFPKFDLWLPLHRFDSIFPSQMQLTNRTIEKIPLDDGRTMDVERKVFEIKAMYALSLLLPGASTIGPNYGEAFATDIDKALEYSRNINTDRYGLFGSGIRPLLEKILKQSDANANPVQVETPTLIPTKQAVENAPDAVEIKKMTRKEALIGTTCKLNNAELNVKLDALSPTPTNNLVKFSLDKNYSKYDEIDRLLAFGIVSKRIEACLTPDQLYRFSSMKGRYKNALRWIHSDEGPTKKQVENIENFNKELKSYIGHLKPDEKNVRFRIEP